MTPAEFRDALDTCGWSAQGVALMCGYSRQAGDAWRAGRSPVPEPVAAWLRRQVKRMLKDPPPRRAA